jgi:hypothetical protein
VFRHMEDRRMAIKNAQRQRGLHSDRDRLASNRLRLDSQHLRRSCRKSISTSISTDGLLNSTYNTSYLRAYCPTISDPCWCSFANANAFEFRQIHSATLRLESPVQLAVYCRNPQNATFVSLLSRSPSSSHTSSSHVATTHAHAMPPLAHRRRECT